MIFPKYRDKEGVSHMVQEQLEEVRQNIRTPVSGADGRWRMSR